MKTVVNSREYPVTYRWQSIWPNGWYKPNPSTGLSTTCVYSKDNRRVALRSDGKVEIDPDYTGEISWIKIEYSIISVYVD